MQGDFVMKIRDDEIKWLKENFPNLQYDEKSQKIIGELDFCAAYNDRSRTVIIGDFANETDFLIRDVYEVEICLGDLDMNGWPKVYEIGKRHCKIAEKYNIKIIDLHINPADNTCCLGIKSPDNRTFRIESFIYERVIPFLYRLSYVEKFGTGVSNDDRWEEYSHGDEGIKEYLTEMINYAKYSPGRNDLCPCDSGKKYKRCHFNDVEPIKFYLNSSCLCRSGKKYKECCFSEDEFLKRYLKTEVPYA